MKKDIYLSVLLLLFAFSIVRSQQVYISDTKGELTINGMGAANYKVPIALPPGIKDVAPQIALVYNSSGNNGIAGYGWNIAGISSITRISTRIDIDGYIDGVDFDDNDQFALDGQRLIKEGSQYSTENYSNLKISSTGTYTYPGASGSGPEKFTITFSDGTQAFYGSTINSRGVSEWLIDKWIDPQGNTIKYEYTNNNNVTYIKKITWSENANTSTNGYFNTIEFFYKSRLRPEMAYLHGVKMTNSRLLDYIEVRTGGQPFRKYQLSHIENELKYQNVSQIQEFNGNNEPTNPIVFEYNTSTNDVIRNDLPFDTGLDINDPDIEITGDLDGDGRLDVIADGKLYRNLFQLGGNASQTDMSFYNYARNVTVNTLENGKLYQAQSIVSYSGSTAYGSMSQYPNLEENHTFSLKPQKLNIGNNTFSEINSRTFSYPHINKITNSDGCMNLPAGFEKWDGEVTKKYIEGDFNGDGLSEVIILGKQLHIDYHVDSTGKLRPELGCNAHYYNYNVPATYVDMNPLVSDSDSFGVTGISYNYDNDKLFSIDFDGDGRNEIMVLGNYGSYRIYRYKNQEIGRFELVTNGVCEYRDLSSDVTTNELDVILIGDYNGDGKTDFIVPTALNSTTWKIYFSNGKEFVSQNVTLDPFEKYNTQHNDRDHNYFNYYTIDIDKDGKSDFIKMFLGLRKPYGTINNTDSRYQFWVKRSINSGGDVNFTHYYDSGFFGYDSPNLPVPITGNYRNAAANYELLIMRSGDNGRLITYDFKKDQSRDMRMNSVNEVGGKILSELTYSSLEPNSANGGLGDINGTYFSSNQENYPFVEIKQLPNLNVVTKLKVSAMGSSKERQFKYFGLTSHSHGWGILGFKKMAQSSWVTSGINTKIWQVSQLSPSLRGAVTENWSFSGNNLNLITNPVESQLLSKKTISYYSYTFPNKRYVLLPEVQTEKDILTNVTKTTKNEFEDYYNLKKSTLQIAGTNASYVTEYEYDNNPSGTGTNYYTGRLKKKSTTAIAYGNTRTSEEKYTYTGTLLTKTETKGHNTDYITETIQYDSFGNVRQKTTSAPGVSSRTIKDEYEPTGRFVKKKTDVDGLVTTLTYNKLGQVLTQTDPLNVTTTSTYDNWGKLTSMTLTGNSDIPLVTTIDYSRDSNGTLTVTSQSNQTKEYSQTYTDVLGRTYRSIAKGFASGTRIAKTTEYDFLGRVTRESEPYFFPDSSPTQWNTIEYDELSRPKKQTAFTGKVTNISYNSLSVTTTENGKTKTVTKDAVGNVASVSDNGEVINYGYYATNELKSSSYGGHTVTVGIDGWGRKTSLLDPSVSTVPYTYEYNNYGEILEETTPNGTTYYTYTPTGKLDTKNIVGDNTDIIVYYQYSDKGLIELETGASDGQSFSTTYEYDSLYRLKKKTETQGMPFSVTFKKEYQYDSLGRINKEITNSSAFTTLTTLVESSVSVNNNYNSYNGLLDHITDTASGTTIWKLTGANARMQAISAQLGNGVNIANTYDAYGYIKNIRHTKSGITAPLSLDYTFNTQKGTLTNRKNNFYNYTENFTYDNFDRLLSWTTPTGTQSNTYETDGRIKTNSNIGSYSYDSSAKYKKKNITLNSAGRGYFIGRTPQTAVYNAFKKPVSVTEKNRGTIEFDYDIYGVRNSSVEWTTDEPSGNASDIVRTKFYSRGGDVEIIQKGAAGSSNQPLTRIITYIGGNAYSAPALYVTDYTNPSSKTSNYHYLHRDFQGSIMAITNQTGTVVERRHYDVWGNVSKFTNTAGTTVTDPDLTGGEFFFDRGYTGHEHFFRVGIIHMNGRIYDPVLKGFMSPDNFVQDPQNSQNFNRYAYCLNNPLMYTDPSGEYGVWEGVAAAAIIATIIAAGNYTYQALTTWMEFSPMGLYKSATIGGVTGAAMALVSYGVGSLASQMFVNTACTATTTATSSQIAMNTIGKAAFQVVMHGLSQGAITGVSGGNFWQGFAAGAVSSVVSSGSMQFNEGIGLSGTAGDVSTMFFGTISGGLSAELTGGNFWQGAATGLVVSALNHVAHRSDASPYGCSDCPKGVSEGTTYYSETDGRYYQYNNGRWGNVRITYTLNNTTEDNVIALGSGGMLEWISGGGPIKGGQWLAKMLKKYPGSITTATKVGDKYWKYTVEVAGKNGSTIYTKYLNLQGKTVQWFHDTYNSANKFMHREFNAAGGRLKVWWDGVREFIQK